MRNRDPSTRIAWIACQCPTELLASYVNKVTAPFVRGLEIHGTVYIGETGRRLADRFREHRLDVLHKKSDFPVAQYFNSPGHSLEDVSRRAKIGPSKEGCPPTRGDETNFQIPNTRSSRDKLRFLIYIRSRDMGAHFFRTRKQFQNSTRLQITISLFYVAA